MQILLSHLFLRNGKYFKAWHFVHLSNVHGKEEESIMMSILQVPSIRNGSSSDTEAQSYSPLTQNPSLKNNFQAPLCQPQGWEKSLITVQKELYILTHFLKDQ